MKPSFFSIQATYSTIQVNLYQQTKCLASHTPKESYASSHLIPILTQLLKDHALTLNDMNFIAIDKGPGAFTSLRAGIASINGIAFAHKIPLIGINSLEALTWEVIKNNITTIIPHTNVIVALLNAYGNDVYFLITDIQDINRPKELATGCCNIDLLLEKLNTLPSKAMLFTGNGFELHQTHIKASLKKNVHIYSILQATPTADAIGALGLNAFMKQKEPCYKIEPLYMKTQTFAIRTNSNKQRS